MTDLSKLDLYALLGVNETSSTKEITTGFRQQALKCHPDKYPDDNEKAELFLLIKKAAELLTDKQARETYDACRKQKKVQEERLSQMDVKRKRFKETLDEKERQASDISNTRINKTNNDRLRAEVERLRREGNRLVIDELEKLHQFFEQDKQKPQSNNVHLIVKFLPNTLPYTDDQLRDIFNKYGNISTIVNRDSKRALIEFNNEHISTFIENEKGFNERPFASVKLRKQSQTTTTTATSSSSASVTKKANDIIDLTKPDLEDLEAMIFKKMAEQTAATVS